MSMRDESRDELNGQMDHIESFLQNEMPVQLANACQGNKEPLLNLGEIANGIPQLLVEPNPTTWDELMGFQSKPIFHFLIHAYCTYFSQLISVSPQLRHLACHPWQSFQPGGSRSPHIALTCKYFFFKFNHLYIYL